MTSVGRIQFGRDVAVDGRDRRFKIRKLATDRRYKYWYDLRCNLDQGSSPHCVGYAWSHWLLCEPINQFLQPAGVYEIVQHYDEWEGNSYSGTANAGA